MKRNLIIAILILFCSVSAWGLNDKKDNDSIEQKNATLEEQKRLFRHNISQIAADFIYGLPC